MAKNYINTVKLPGDDETYYLKDSEARETAAGKISNPSTKQAGNFLKFNGTDWVAEDVPDTGVLSVASNDTVIKVTGTDEIELEANITASQGNVTLTKETDGLKADIADNALTIAKTNGLQIALDAKELSANKVASWSTTPDNAHYPGEKLVKDELDNVRAVAEGKTKSYVIDAKSDITGTYVKATDSYTNVTAITGVTVSELKVGDNILVKAVDVADYWVSAITGDNGICLNKLETTKVDLSEYAKTADLGALATKDSASVTYTPAGTVSTPTITVEANTTTVNSITDVGTLPTWSATVASETLTFAWGQGTLPTKGDNTTVATGIKSATSTQPTFSGTEATITVE